MEETKVISLKQEIEALLKVAPLGVYVFERMFPKEVLVATKRGVWLSIAEVESEQRREEYRILEWGFDDLTDLRDVHFFFPKWDLLTWLTNRFSELKVEDV